MWFILLEVCTTLWTCHHLSGRVVVSYVVGNEIVPTTPINTTPSHGVYPNPKGNRQNCKWKQSNFFFGVFLPLLFMLWLELCQHGQEGQQATHLMHSLISAGWALLVFYNMNILGIFFFSYSCNTFFVMATNGLFVFFWLFILFFVMSTHTPCPVKIKSDGYWDILS